jgi:hypothetical protein
VIFWRNFIDGVATFSIMIAKGGLLCVRNGDYGVELTYGDVDGDFFLLQGIRTSDKVGMEKFLK